MKTEVYSWRVSTEVKTELEREARRRKMSLSAVLDLATRAWLKSSAAEGYDEQLRLQNDASKYFGTLASGDAHRSENARRAVRQRLQSQNDR